MAKRKRRRPGETLLYGFIALFSLLVMVPFLFTVIHSLMPVSYTHLTIQLLGLLYRLKTRDHPALWTEKSTEDEIIDFHQEESENA